MLLRHISEMPRIWHVDGLDQHFAVTQDLTARVQPSEPLKPIAKRTQIEPPQASSDSLGP